MEATGVTVAYGATTVLRDLNLRVARGEIYALLGGNGAGKSTTLNAFLGFLAPQTGSVRVCGIDVAADPLANFINRNPTVVMLALGFLLMIGAVLIADGFGVHVPKGYIYAAMRPDRAALHSAHHQWLC